MCPAYREAEKTRLLITTQTQRIVEKEAETERKRAIIGKSALLLCNTCVHLFSLMIFLLLFKLMLDDRGSKGGPSGRDPVPAEGDGERDRKKDL